jgi:hypothetical protein
MTEKSKKSTRAAVDAKKELSRDGVRTVVLSTGYKVRLKPVAASLIDQVVGQIKDPEVPMWMDESKGREEPNPSDPTYLAQMKEADRSRGIAAIDAMVMFGVEVVDGIPDDGWDKKLNYLQKRGVVDLSEFDLDDEDDREFVFKRFVAMSAEDLAILAGMSGLNEEDVSQAVDSFRS